MASYWLYCRNRESTASIYCVIYCIYSNMEELERPLKLLMHPKSLCFSLQCEIRFHSDLTVIGRIQIVRLKRLLQSF